MGDTPNDMAVMVADWLTDWRKCRGFKRLGNTTVKCGRLVVFIEPSKTGNGLVVGWVGNDGGFPLHVGEKGEVLNYKALLDTLSVGESGVVQPPRASDEAAAG